MKKHRLIALLPTLILVMWVTPSLAAGFDTGTGKKLVDEHCYACHGTDVYTRDNRRVTSRSGLSAQVQRCELALNLNWFDDDVENSAEYLNLEFYHFKK